MLLSQSSCCRRTWALLKIAASSVASSVSSASEARGSAWTGKGFTTPPGDSATLRLDTMGNQYLKLSGYLLVCGLTQWATSI